MRRAVLAAGAATAWLAVGSANAETLRVTYVGRGFDVSWIQSSDPTPISSNPGDSTDVPVTNFTGTGPYSDIIYLTSASRGGFATSDFFIYGYGPQLFSGSVSDPVFSPGSFAVYVPGGFPGGVITFSVPEPSTWAMMLAGFAGLGALTLRSRRRALAA